MPNQPFSAKIVNEREFRRVLTSDWPDSTRFAVANTASRIAFLGMEKSESQMRREFDLKNRYIVGASPGTGVLKFERAIPHRNLNMIQSSWGTPYKKGSTDLGFMEDQEDGFTHDGSTPALNARVGRSQSKMIKRNLRRRQIELLDSRGYQGESQTQKMLIFLKNAYHNRYGMPGSKQFIYLHKGDFGRFREGMYQFSSSAPRMGRQFPNIRAIYYTDGRNRSRKATHWMELSKNQIKQYDIDRIYQQEANKAFTRDLRRRW